MDVEFKDLSYTVKPRPWSRKGTVYTFHSHATHVAGRPVSERGGPQRAQFSKMSFVFPTGISLYGHLMQILNYFWIESEITFYWIS
jgi:hypothetical protein